MEDEQSSSASQSKKEGLEEIEEESRQRRGSPEAAEEMPYVGSPHSHSGKKIPFLLGFAIIILVLAISLFLFRGSGEKLKPSPVPSVVEGSSSISESESIPSPKASFDRSKYTLRVLNGTKLNGLAASTSAKLKELGYKIEKVANATNSAFPKTVVRVKPDLKELLENLIKDLMPGSEGEEGPELKESDSAFGEVILGLE